ncbi:MAG: S4 domain-containing protein [Lacisediminimonas sp.]|nr:S4 domain-containing protein [Lacisediminimonas sp.]
MWAARFFKTRSLATQAVESGRVRLGGERVKPARNLKRGERLHIENESGIFDIDVIDLGDKRGPAAFAQSLYLETPASIAQRQVSADDRRLFREPATSIKGRPTKRDRRQLDRE